VPSGDDAITTEVASVGRQWEPSASMTRCRGPAVRCPRCKLVVASRMPTLAPRHCPRCLARSRIPVELEMLPSQCSGESPPGAPGLASSVERPGHARRAPVAKSAPSTPTTAGDPGHRPSAHHSVAGQSLTIPASGRARSANSGPEETVAARLPFGSLEPMSTRQINRPRTPGPT
jgi:hypothetical protein